jgi:anion-transporting  ArsA/GET3 family ATPase
MAQILTFLGKGGCGRTTIAIATAKQQASLGRRVLFVSQDPTPATGILLGMPLQPVPQPIGANLSAVQVLATAAIDRGWEEVKQLEARYLRSPLLGNVYAQELPILPGMDSAIALNELRRYDASGNYDSIVFDGSDDLATIGMAGIPETLDWYLRRFQTVFTESDLWRTVAPIVQPALAAVLTIAWTGESIVSQPLQEANNYLALAQSTISDPRRVVAYLITDDRAESIARAKYLWANAQQSSLAVAGVIFNRAETTAALTDIFAPLTAVSIPTIAANDWQSAIESLPDFSLAQNAPRSMVVDPARREIRLYLPGLDKTQVKLTQSGPEITVEAADRRRNLLLPPPLTNARVTGAKFQDGYLIISV